jgi:conjugative transfer region lipoprotein (TIGR03751 family)
MARHQWTNSVLINSISFLTISFLLIGCASHIDKVVPKNLPTMKQVYDEKAGSGGVAILRQREADIRARSISSDEDYLSELPPRAAQINHLFPALPNPELYMYVKPHVIGSSGAAVPAYMTRFTMYDRTHYAMPNEVISHIKHPGIVLQQDGKETANKQAASKNPKNKSITPLLSSERHGD